MKRVLYQNLFVVAVIDILLIALSWYFAHELRFNFEIPDNHYGAMISVVPFVLLIKIPVFYLFDLYRGMWRYIGINDLIRYVGASIVAGGLSWGIIYFIFTQKQFPVGVFLLFSIFLIIGLAGSRSSFLYLDRIYSKQFRGVEKQNILLYGAEDAGEIALRWILRNPDIGYNVVGFMDGDSLKWGSNIHGVSILGDVENLNQYIQDKKVCGVIATSENLLATPVGEKLKTDCHSLGVWVLVLRLEFELTD